MVLECGNEFFHVLPWLGKQNPFVLLIEFALQFFRYELRISDEYSIKVFIEFEEYLGAVSIGRREVNREQLSFEIRRQMQFYPIVMPFSRVSPLSESVHGLWDVAFLLRQTGISVESVCLMG